MYSFVRPLVDQSNNFINHLPGYVEDARAGRGTVGELVKRYKIDDWVERNQANLRKAAQQAGRPAVKVAQSVASGLAALVTILVLTFLMGLTFLLTQMIEYARVGFAPHFDEEGLRDLALQQPVAILRERRVIPHGFIHAQAH